MKDKTVKLLVLEWIAESGKRQNELAKALDISAASLNQMIHGTKDIDLPLSRFIQIVSILHPRQDDIDKVFSIYLADQGIPISAMRLVISHPNSTQTARERVHSMVDQLPDVQVIALEQFLNSILKKEDAGK